jgi:hypothetical protein
LGRLPVSCPLMAIRKYQILVRFVTNDYSLRFFLAIQNKSFDLWSRWIQIQRFSIYWNPNASRLVDTFNHYVVYDGWFELVDLLDCHVPVTLLDCGHAYVQYLVIAASSRREERNIR